MNRDLSRVSRWVMIISIVNIVILYPVASVMTLPITFENGILENTQAVFLLISALICYGWAFKKDSVRHPLWFGVGGAFLLMFGRELSWGRVLLVKGFEADGSPTIMPSSEYVYRDIAHITSYGVGVVSLICIIIYTPWKAVFKHIPIPKMAFIVTLLLIMLVSMGEHHQITGNTLPDVAIEEFGELLVYIQLSMLTVYYYFWIKAKSY